MNSKVLILMSGGIDSSVAAAILKEQGYRVGGLTFSLLGKDTDSESIEDAKQVARILGVEHFVIDLSSYFNDTIIKYFLQEYRDGRTPNVCALCNREIKIKMGLHFADELGFDYIATGHYARVQHDGQVVHLKKALWKEKSQEYYLALTDKSDLARVLFPLGEFSKAEVRKKARELGYSIHEKEESQDICFVGKDYRDFLKNRGFNVKKGVIRDLLGNVLGTHDGYYFFTIGQRRGLGVSGGERLYVRGINPQENEITVAPLKSLYDSCFYVGSVNLIEDVGNQFIATVRVRYRGEEAEARLRKEGELYKVELTRRLFAVTPGQIAVFYEGDLVVGGGFIVEKCR